ncbi:Scopoletin glucosyltransferase [Capsicum annuum]|nr:Scopoletin glucosyltransferase [Capsicum annuum]
MSQLHFFFFPLMAHGHMIPTLDMAKLVASRGCERLDFIPSPDLVNNFFKVTAMMQEQFKQLVEEWHSNCLVSDMLFPWTTDTAAKFNIPRLVFHGTCFFALCVAESIRHHKPFKNVSSNSEIFVVPNLSHQIKLTTMQLSPFDLIEEETIIFQIFHEVREANLKSYGVFFNSFYELELDYVERYTNVLSRKIWAIGPLLPVQQGH